MTEDVVYMEDTHVPQPNGEGIVSHCDGGLSSLNQGRKSPIVVENLKNNKKMNKDKDISESSNSDSSLDIVEPCDIGFRTASADDRQAKSKIISHLVVRPKETKTSQLHLRTKSDPAETILPQRNYVKRQSSLLKETASTNSKPGSIKDKQVRTRRSLSQSTSSDDNSEKDIMELASGKGSITRSDFKSRSMKNATQTNTQCSAAARQDFAETHHLFGLSGPAKKTPQLSGRGLKTHEDPVFLDSSHQNKSKCSPHVCSPVSMPADKYLTPLQQKDKLLRELNAQLSKLEKIVHEQAERIQHFEEEKENELENVRKMEDLEKGKLRNEIKRVEMQYEQSECTVTEMIESLTSEKQTVISLKQYIDTMKKELDDREMMHQQRYLDMYQKGREAQLIDQEEDLICTAFATAPDKDAPTRHLVKSLEKKEQELEKLRQTFREDVYHKSPLLDTDSAAQVEILKSAVYYHLTDMQPDVNLSVMLSLLSYSEVQKKNIISHLKKKKSK